jgi:hypothetical protein
MTPQNLRFLFGALLLASVSALGCGENHTPPATIDVGVARQSLERALAAWKGQVKPDSLRQDAKAPLHVADEDWIMGYQLQAFELTQGEPKPMTAACVRFEVKLDLTSPQGQRIQRKAQYSVTTSPSICVIREETNV